MPSTGKIILKKILMTTIFNNNSCKEKKKTNFLGEAIKLYFKAKKLEKSVQ
jgi:hypothetical protein